jgi:hypothetical protein
MVGELVFFKQHFQVTTLLSPPKKKALEKDL